MAEVENILFPIVLGGYFLMMALYFAFCAVKKEKLAHAAMAVQTAVLILHTAALAARGIAAGRLPMTNQYEFASCFAWALCLVSLLFIRKYRFTVLGAFASPVVLLIIGYAAMQSREVKALMPALQSNWLAFHVSTAIISYGSFGVSFVLGLIYLFRGTFRGKGEERSFLDRHIPGEDKLDLLAYRSVSLGMLFLTMTILTGAIWAEQAWGSYWSWDPKETWSLVTWIIYAVYLHLRLRRNWKGKAAAVFAVAGFVCVIFTYIGVNTFLPGVHSYA